MLGFWFVYRFLKRHLSKTNILILLTVYCRYIKTPILPLPYIKLMFDLTFYSETYLKEEFVRVILLKVFLCNGSNNKIFSNQVEINYVYTKRIQSCMHSNDTRVDK